jgi:hypothetical protein
MTETDWLTSTDPRAMLDFVQETARTSDRKLRLFACACCRRVWHLFDEARSREAVEVAEMYADGLATEYELNIAYGHACMAADAPSSLNNRQPGVGMGPEDMVRYAAVSAAERRRPRAEGTSDAVNLAVNSELPAQAALLRCLFGNPFRPLPRPDAAWLTPRVLSLANGIYERRAFDHLPELASLLEDAGCREAEVLGHLRGPGPHARGCHVLDAILGQS